MPLTASFGAAEANWATFVTTQRAMWQKKQYFGTAFYFAKRAAIQCIATVITINRVTISKRLSARLRSCHTEITTDSASVPIKGM